MRVMKWSMIALAVSAGTSQFAIASSQDDAKGFIEDSTLTAKTRAMYMNRDYKDGVGNGVVVTVLTPQALTIKPAATVKTPVSANCSPISPASLKAPSASASMPWPWAA